jgi:hypothetical protein
MDGREEHASAMLSIDRRKLSSLFVLSSVGGRVTCRTMVCDVLDGRPGSLIESDEILSAKSSASLSMIASLGDGLLLQARGNRKVALEEDVHGHGSHSASI